jgi:hypothetical protein
MVRDNPLLPRKVKAALDDFQRRVLEMFPGEISQIILYGSHARGDARPDSDVDVLVIVKWKDPQRPNGFYWGRPSDPRWRELIDAATDAMIAHGPLISAVVIGEGLLEANLPIVQSAQQEGKVLWKNPPI